MDSHQLSRRERFGGEHRAVVDEVVRVVAALPDIGRGCPIRLKAGPPVASDQGLEKAHDYPEVPPWVNQFVLKPWTRSSQGQRELITG